MPASQEMNQYLLSVPVVPWGQHEIRALLKEAERAEQALKHLIPLGEVATFKALGEGFHGEVVCCDTHQRKDNSPKGWTLYVTVTGTERAAQTLANAFPDRTVTDYSGRIVIPPAIGGSAPQRQRPLAM